MRSLNFGLRLIERVSDDTNDGADANGDSESSTTYSDDSDGRGVAAWIWWLLAIVAVVATGVAAVAVLGRRNRESTSGDIR